MRRRDVRADVLNAVALGLRRAAVLLGRLAHTVERPAGGARADEAKFDRSLDSARSLPAEETVDRSGQPPAHWLERVRSGGPPEHWLRALRQAHVETFETHRAAVPAGTISSASSTQRVSGEARDDHARTPDEFQATPAARSVTSQSNSKDRAAPARSRVERQESPAVPEAIEASPARPAAEEQPPTVPFVSSAASTAKSSAPIRRRSDRVENPERVKRFRLQPVSAVKGETMPAPVEAVEETASEAQRETLEDPVTLKPPAKRSTRGWPQPGVPPELTVDEQFVARKQSVRQAVLPIAQSRETVEPLHVIQVPAPIDISAPNVTATQAAKVAERWAPLELITPPAEPAKDNWADLPDEQSMALYETPLDEDWDMRVRSWRHLQQLDLEQRGMWWNESPF